MSSVFTFQRKDIINSTVCTVLRFLFFCTWCICGHHEYLPRSILFSCLANIIQCNLLHGDAQTQTQKAANEQAIKFIQNAMLYFVYVVRRVVSFCRSLHMHIRTRTKASILHVRINHPKCASSFAARSVVPVHTDTGEHTWYTACIWMWYLWECVTLHCSHCIHGWISGLCCVRVCVCVYVCMSVCVCMCVVEE